jgi:ATP-dependent RNA helicase RhlB
VAAAPAAAQGEHAPRKRRRRRGGKRIEGADAVQQRSGSGQEVTKPRGSGRHPAPAPKPQAGGTGEPSLLSRIGRGLKSLVTRAPRSQH